MLVKMSRIHHLQSWIYIFASQIFIVKLFAFLRRWFRKDPEIPSEMKYLIIGLGNMGYEYDGNRHNLGFEVVDTLAQ